MHLSRQEQGQPLLWLSRDIVGLKNVVLTYNILYFKSVSPLGIPVLRGVGKLVRPG